MKLIKSVSDLILRSFRHRTSTKGTRKAVNLCVIIDNVALMGVSVALTGVSVALTGVSGLRRSLSSLRNLSFLSGVSRLTTGARRALALAGFFLLLSLPAFSQGTILPSEVKQSNNTPGGLAPNLFGANLEFWLRADKLDGENYNTKAPATIPKTDNAEVKEWTSRVNRGNSIPPVFFNQQTQSKFNMQSRTGDNGKITLKLDGINFNPALVFPGGSVRMAYSIKGGIGGAGGLFGGGSSSSILIGTEGTGVNAKNAYIAFYVAVPKKTAGEKAIFTLLDEPIATQNPLGFQLPQLLPTSSSKTPIRPYPDGWEVDAAGKTLFYGYGEKKGSKIQDKTGIQYSEQLEKPSIITVGKTLSSHEIRLNGKSISNNGGAGMSKMLGNMAAASKATVENAADVANGFLGGLLNPLIDIGKKVGDQFAGFLGIDSHFMPASGEKDISTVMVGANNILRKDEKMDNDGVFTGEIYEILLIDAVTVQTAITGRDAGLEDAIVKINSYLAVKYGITLDMDKWEASNGTVIWDKTKNTGYNNNIFGIARDDQNALLQKQSVSVNDNTLTMFLGKNLATLSMDNQSFLICNGAYTLLGSNNEPVRDARGDPVLTPYKVDAGAQYGFNTNNRYKLPLGENFTNRYKRVYKAQVKPGVDEKGQPAQPKVSMQLKNMKVAYIMVSKTAEFKPEDTNLYPVKVDPATGHTSEIEVAVADGNYIGFIEGVRTPDTRPVTARNDTLTTSPAQRIVIDPTVNDIFHCSPPTVTINSVKVREGIDLTVPPVYKQGAGAGSEWSGLTSIPADIGTWEELGNGKFAFKPHMNVWNKTLEVTYTLTCGLSSNATIFITVGDYNYPANQLTGDDAGCTAPFGSTEFKAHEKYNTFAANGGLNPTTNKNDGPVRLDGRQNPIVADLNGDGKPEIITFGLEAPDDGNAQKNLFGTGRFIHVFDGQTGKRIRSARLYEKTYTTSAMSATYNGYDNLERTTKLDIGKETDFILSRNNTWGGSSGGGTDLGYVFFPWFSSPGRIAVADLDGDGLPEIVLIGASNDGKVVMIKPTVDKTTKAITGFTKVWEKDGKEGYRAATPVLETDKERVTTGKNARNFTHIIYSAPMPYIVDIDGDGIPEVIVYNKIYNGKTGALVQTLQQLHRGDVNPMDDKKINTKLSNADDMFNVDIQTWKDKYAYVGRMPMMRGDRYTSCMAIADVDNDKIMDLVAGSKVYKMKTGAKLDKIIHGPDRITTHQLGLTDAPNKTYYLADGFTTVADIDGDGKLEVIVYNIVDYISIFFLNPTKTYPHPNPVGVDPNTGSYFTSKFNLIIYVWDPTNPTVIKAASMFHFNSWRGHISMPFFGDINGYTNGDGKRLPELCFVTGSLNTKGTDFGNTTVTNGNNPDAKPEVFSTQSWINKTAYPNGFTITKVNKVLPYPGTDGNNPLKQLHVGADGNIDNYIFNRAVSNFTETVPTASILGFTWDNPKGTEPIYQRLKLSFAQEAYFSSQVAGISTFDFNNDGNQDICFKDSRSMQVISPAITTNPQWSYIPYKTPVTTPASPTPVLFKQDVFAGPGFESPVIADVNMDGSADIIITAFEKEPDYKNIKNKETPLGDRNEPSYGHLYVFEHAPGSTKWSPSPPIWNQARYEPNLINADLSVPVRPASMLTRYVTKDGIDIYPYNTHWTQQPFVKAVAAGGIYEAASRTPDHIVVDNMKMVLSNSDKTAKITISIKNGGTASIASITPVAFYWNDSSTPTIDATVHSHIITHGTTGTSLDSCQLLGVDIFPGETITKEFTIQWQGSTALPGDNFNGKIVWVRIVDNGQKAGAELEGFSDCHSFVETAKWTGICGTPLKYTVAGDSLLCSLGDCSVQVIARAATPAGAGTTLFKWFKVDDSGKEVAVPTTALPAADSILTVSNAANTDTTGIGKYICHIQNGTCKTTVTVNVKQYDPRAKNDHVTLTHYVPIKIYFKENDDIPVSCVPYLSPSIYMTPPNGAVLNPTAITDYIEYTMAAGKLYDTIIYALDAAKQVLGHIYIQMDNPIPDNMFLNDCHGELPTGEFTFDWGNLGVRPNPANNNIYTYTMALSQIPLAGDLDNDNFVDIVIALSQDNTHSGGLVVYDPNENNRQTSWINFPTTGATSTAKFLTTGYGPFGIAKYADKLPKPGDTKNYSNIEAYIVVAAADGYLYAFNKSSGYKEGGRARPTATTNAVWKSNVKYKTGNGNDEVRGMVSFTDFNGDGFAEVYIDDKIFDLETGILFLDLNVLTGTAGAMAKNLSLDGGDMGTSFAADFDDDGRPELVLSDRVYKIEIESRTDASKNSATLWSRLDATATHAGSSDSHSLIADRLGRTVVADFNGDDILDVLVCTHDGFYIWTPVKPASVNTAGTGKRLLYRKEWQYQSQSQTITESAVVHGFPMVADIDKDDFPEILFTGDKNLIQTWRLGKTPNGVRVDAIQGNAASIDSYLGMSFFDLDNEGNGEILYRDATNFRVYRADPNFGNAPKQVVIDPNTNPLRSGEYPVIIGYDQEYEVNPGKDDGIWAVRHETVVLTIHNNNNNSASLNSGVYSGILRINTMDKNKWTKTHQWTAARRVWNQYAYNSLNINEDLTVPRYSVSPAFVPPYPEDGSSVKRPYNGILMQQTYLNREGEPLVTLPRVEFVGEPVYAQAKPSGELKITMTVKNTGSKAFDAPFKVTVYKGGVQTSNGADRQIFSQAYNKKIEVDEEVTFTVTVPATKMDTWWKNDIISGQLYIRLNDGGANNIPLKRSPEQADQLVCTTDEEKEVKIYAGTIARDDYITIFANTTNNVIDVVANDTKTCTKLSDATPPNGYLISLTPDANGVQNGGAKNGQVFIAGSSISYQPRENFAGADTVQYKLYCNGNSSTAYLFINVVSRPDNIVKVDCIGKITPAPMSGNIQELSIVTPPPVGSGSSPNQAPLVGSLDKSGALDIVVPAATITVAGQPAGAYQTNAIHVYSKKDKQSNYVQTVIQTANYATSGYGPLGIAKYNDEADTVAYIVVACSDGLLRAYTKNSYTGQSPAHLVWTSDAVYKLPYDNSNTNPTRGMVGFADFNGDGNVQIYIEDKIFSLETGKLLLDLNVLIDANNAGSNMATNRTYEYGNLGTPIAADFDGDGHPELALSDRVYRIHLENLDGTTGNTGTRWKKLRAASINNGGTYPTNRDWANTLGKTVVADFNNDGQLDVLVTFGNGFYVWTPDASVTGEEISAPLYQKTDMTPTTGAGNPYYTGGFPAVGDITGDGVPDIVITVFDRILAFNGTNGAFLWYTPATGNTISSNYVGVSLFDFNQDGKMEIVIRDKAMLRILQNPTGSNQQNLSALVVKEISCPSSFTSQGEYPVIADVDGDGIADIVTTSSTTAANGTIKIFTSSDKSWASSRSVWNQHAYNVLNINQNLTVPRTLMNPSKTFNSEPRFSRPYNGFLKQQSFISEEGKPFTFLPRVELYDGPSFWYYEAGDSLQVGLVVRNIGTKAFAAPFKVTVYRNDDANNPLAIPSTVKQTFSYNEVIQVGSQDTIFFTIKNFKHETDPNKKLTPFQNLVLRINDDGVKYPAQAVCDNNPEADAVIISNIAIDDYVTVFANSYGNRIPVTLNDIKYFADNDVYVEALSLTGNGYINSALGDSILVYTPDYGFYGIDTLIYVLIDLRDETFSYSFAFVYINVCEQPDNILDVEDEGEYCCLSNYENYISSPDGGNISLQRSINNAGAGAGVLVGDLDGDGVPEIVAYNTTGSTITGITAYNGQTGAATKYTYTFGQNEAPVAVGGVYPTMSAVIVNSDYVYGDEDIARTSSELVIVLQTGDVISYELQIDQLGDTVIGEKWKTTGVFPSASFGVLPQPVFFGIGYYYPIIVVANKLLDAETGDIIGTIENGGTPFIGRSGNQGNMPALGDFDGDGLYEIAAGGKVYKVTIIDDGKADVTIMSAVADIGDGFTAVADVNMDGLLDVIVANVVKDNSNVDQTRITVWTPMLKAKIGEWTVSGEIGAGNHADMPSDRHSYLAIGNLDNEEQQGKVYPSICIATKGRLSAFRFNPVSGKFEDLARYSTGDASGHLGFALFDFDGEGINHIAYNGPQGLELIKYDGGLQSYYSYPLTASAGNTLSYPVIADSDGDGSANIVLTRIDAGTPKVLTFEGKDNRWNSTVKKWNQVNYDPDNTYENLSVVAYPMPKNASLDGKYSYNGALLQVPVMINDGDYSKLQRSSDPSVVPAGIRVVFNGGGNADVFIQIRNNGWAYTNPNVPVALYNIKVEEQVQPPREEFEIGGKTHYGDINGQADVDANTVIAMDSIKAYIAPGDTYEMVIHTEASKVSGDLSIRIMDNGVNFPVYSFLDCDLENNALGMSGKQIMPQADTISTTMNTSVDYDIFRNDSLLSCNKTNLTKFDTVANTPLINGWLKNGIVEYVFLSDVPGNPNIPNVPNVSDIPDRIRYIPNKGFYGIDSMRYYVKCGPDSAAATAYFIVHKPLSRKYIACPDVSVTMGFNNIAGVTYKWYTEQTGGTEIASGLTYTKTKAGKTIELWWVEPTWKGTKLPRIYVELEPNDCGKETPSECAVTGTVLFKEDFGGNGPQFPWQSSTALPAGMTDYTFTDSPNLLNNTYALMKTPRSYPNFWHQYGITDHTINPAQWNYSGMPGMPGTLVNGNLNSGRFSSGTMGGYMMVVDAHTTPKMFFKLKLENLCPDAELFFSAWVLNLIRRAAPAPTWLDPALRFVVEDEETGEILAEYHTGSLERDVDDRNPVTTITTAAPATGKWREYGFKFKPNAESVILKIYNDELGGNGNDLALDDIEVRLCASEVTVASPAIETSVCVGAHIPMIGSYVDNGTFGDNLASIWVWTEDDPSNDLAIWHPIDESRQFNEGGAPGQITNTYTLHITENHDRYYRLVVGRGNSGGDNLGEQYNCNATSKPVQVKVFANAIQIPRDIRVYVNPTGLQTISLSRYTDSLDYAHQRQWYDPAKFVLNTATTTGTLDVSGWRFPLTNTYSYSIATESCDTRFAKAYVHTLRDNIPYDRTEVISVCRTLSTSRRINLNQLLGIVGKESILDPNNGGLITCIKPAKPATPAGMSEAEFDALFTQVTNLICGEMKRETRVGSNYYGMWLFNAQAAYILDQQYGFYFSGGYSGFTKQFEFEYTASDGLLKKRLILLVEDN